ncbi:unnamed protein product [Cuscuta epithymum]|uniref:Uncharacterized protein n=1 Tax=Cuscuta epithymum TaxID=186058 RepID=A0AAV0FPK9_9ASTE|nr:unnamed protein product [Cuscuta epithymum]
MSLDIVPVLDRPVPVIGIRTMGLGSVPGTRADWSRSQSRSRPGLILFFSFPSDSKSKRKKVARPGPKQRPLDIGPQIGESGSRDMLGRTMGGPGSEPDFLEPVPDRVHL